MVQDDDIQEIVRSNRPTERREGTGYFIIALCVVAAIPIGLALWQGVYERFLEPVAPTITALEVPEGLGSTPSSLKLRIQDSGAGLDELVVRIKPKKGAPREFYKRELSGKHETEEVLEIGGDGSGIDPGTVTILVRAFDRSFWSNSAEMQFNFIVDYTKPKAEVITSQHNARVGGAQLVFYKTSDPELRSSGIKVGERYFTGFPARGIDNGFLDTKLKAVLYAIDMRETETNPQVKVFSENNVRNIALGNFYNVVLPRKVRPVVKNVVDNQIEPLVKDDFASVSNVSNPVVHWTLPFLVPKGSIHLAFGDQIIYKNANSEVGRELVTGYEFKLTPSERAVNAIDDATVVAVETSKKFGHYVVLDHGFGIASIYDRLESVQVKKGDVVRRGQALGSGGQREGAKTPELYFELRIQGVPVDAREWWEDRWCKDHINKKIIEMKRLNGVAF